MRGGSPYVHPLVTALIYIIGAFGIVFVAAFLFILSLLILPAHGHSFYPWECCHDRDCEAISSSRVEGVPGGYLIDGLHYVAERDARNSPDGQYHACFPKASTNPRCFWRPPRSV